MAGPGFRVDTDDVISSSDLTPSGLTGRAAETAAIRRALRHSRLVTVTGLPGVGKTAASIAAAMSSAGRYPDGVALIRLDALSDEALLPHSIAGAMLLPDSFDTSPLVALTNQLADKSLLLVLDTCEHLLGACAAVISAILEICPGVRVLATSREPLRVPGENLFLVAQLTPRDAVTLFNQHATAWGATLSDPHSSSVVQAVCDRLDGLPLAVGLAARQLATGSLDALLAGLEGGYDFLSDPVAPVPRHQTLQAAIGWSHQLCTPAERLLWARLTVFDESFCVKDCQEVCATTHLTDDNVAVGVAMLADRSILVRTAGEPARFTMPETIRAYGQHMLRRLAEDEEMRRRYRLWRSGPRRDALWH
jgi:predicted ATPase